MISQLGCGEHNYVTFPCLLLQISSVNITPRRQGCIDFGDMSKQNSTHLCHAKEQYILWPS